MDNFAAILGGAILGIIIGTAIIADQKQKELIEMGDAQSIWNGMFDMLEKKAAQSIGPNEGDYVIDGLLYCGKCHTPKQCRVHLFGEDRTPYCMCKCLIEKKKENNNEKNIYPVLTETGRATPIA